MKSRWLITTAAVLPLLLAPGVARAQDVCIWGCNCSPVTGACDCSAYFGTGRDCHLPIGGGCEVIRCDKLETYWFAPDGSVLRMKEMLAGTSTDPVTIPADTSLRWTTLSPGRSVGVDCRGIVVRTVMDRGTADAMRERDRVVLL